MKKTHYIEQSTTLQKGYTLGNPTFYDATCGYTGDNISEIRFTHSVCNVTCKKCQRIIESRGFNALRT